MDLIDKYNMILENEQSLLTINNILDLQNDFLKDNDFLHYYLCTNRIIDIYINEGDLKNALEVALDLYEKSNITSFKESYHQVLDQLIYIYITKQYYQRALLMLNEKKELIDLNNSEEVNRLYLEFSYIHEALGEKNSCLSKLEAILANNPTPEMKAVVLNNITKLYIDSNDFDNAKKTLQENITLVDEINDDEGKRYCKYLQSLIYHFEGNLKEAKKVLNELYKEINIDDNFNERFSYLNEYFTIILDMCDNREAIDIINKFIDKVISCDDLHNKHVFLKNMLLLGVTSPNSLKKVKKGMYTTEIVLNMISELEKEINNNNDIKTSEIKEDELSLQMTNSENVLYSKLLSALEDINLNYEDGSLRSLLMNYSYSLRNKVLFDEALYIVLSKENTMIIPNIETSLENITTYQYKNEKLYERDSTFNDMIQTPVETIISGEKEINVTLGDDINFLDPISRKAYREMYKYLYAVPLMKNDKVYGVCIYLSNVIDLTNIFSKTMLKLSSQYLSYALMSLFNQNCNLLQYNLLNTCDAKSNSGIFYYSAKENCYLLSSKLKKMLQMKDIKVSKADFAKNIIKSDLKEYMHSKDELNNKEAYETNYHMNIDNKSILLSESASPYLSSNGELFYCGRIAMLEFNESMLSEVKQFHPLSWKELSLQLEGLRKKNFKVLALRSKEDLFTKLYDLFNDNIYFVNDVYYYIINTNKNIKNRIEGLRIDDLSYTIIEYPDKLVRLDDLLGVTSFMLDKPGYIDFGNEIYASYISKSTISECLERALISDSITITKKKFSIDSQFAGEYCQFAIKGIYNNKSLKVIPDDVIYSLYEYIIDSLSKENNNTYLLKIRNSALYRLLNNNKIKDVNIIFDLEDERYANEILNNLNDNYKGCKLIVGNNFIKNISLKTLINNNKIILGFNEKIDDDILDIYQKYNDKYYFYGDEGIKIENGD